MNFFQNSSQGVAKFPGEIAFLEFSHVADPPDVVADPAQLPENPRPVISGIWARCDPAKYVSTRAYGLQKGLCTKKHPFEHHAR